MLRSAAEAEAYINAIPRFTKKNDSAFLEVCLARLGQPQEAFDVIHVAGTNGKGSTCAFLSSVLTAGGYRTALFTSPHLIEMRERFRIGGKMIGKRLFTKAANTVLTLSRSLMDEGLPHPTFFEFLFLMGMWIFREEKVQVAVVETGLGGRLDATNVIRRPLVCVITSVGMDHMQYLGDTVAKIAREKAGIIKPGVPVIYNDAEEDAKQVIEECAAERGAPVVRLSECAVSNMRWTGGGIAFSVSMPYDEGARELAVPFFAPYQVGNAVLALCAYDQIADRYPADPETVRLAVARTRWEGRMQMIAPKVWLDGAHNEEGIAAFCRAAELIAQGEKTVLLFGVMADKDWRSMVRLLVRTLHPSEVFLTRPDGGRGMDPEKLGLYFREEGMENITVTEDVPSAYRAALAAKGDGYLFCAGSLYLIGRILEVHDQL